MRRVLGFILAAGLLATAVACSDDETVTTESVGRSPATSTPTEQTSTSASTSPSEATSATPTRTAPAVAGDTLDLTGQESGETLAVTLVKVVDTAPAENEFSSPDAGMKFVAVQFRLKNTGTAVYSDSPSNGARVIDTQGQQFDASIEDTAAGPGFPGSVTIAPGDSALGFITFEIPARSRVAKAQFAMNSGFSGNTGQWNVSGG
ncbi:DUF4352 domain-containing protein [Streptomyces griseoruber]